MDFRKGDLEAELKVTKLYTKKRGGGGGGGVWKEIGGMPILKR